MKLPEHQEQELLAAAQAVVEGFHRLTATKCRLPDEMWRALEVLSGVVLEMGDREPVPK